jgi:hypothetical protein
MVFIIGNFGTAQLMAQLPKINSTINETEINKALKEALNNGINKQASK